MPSGHPFVPAGTIHCVSLPERGFLPTRERIEICGSWTSSASVKQHSTPILVITTIKTGFVAGGAGTSSTIGAIGAGTTGAAAGTSSNEESVSWRVSGRLGAGGDSREVAHRGISAYGGAGVKDGSGADTAPRWMWCRVRLPIRSSASAARRWIRLPCCVRFGQRYAAEIGATHE